MAVRSQTSTASAAPAGASESQVRPAQGFAPALARYPVFRRLWFASVAGSVGQWMQQIALGWLALVMTDSAAFVGLVSFAAGAPYLIVGPLGGALIDRVDRRKLMLVCQALAALLALAVAADVIAGTIQPWRLIAAGVLNGCLQAILTPTQQSLVPLLVDRADLTNAIGLTSAGQNLTRIAGPSLAGLIIGFVGVGQTFVLQAVASAIAFALVLGIALPTRPPAAAAGRGVFDGIRLIAARPDLRALFLLAAIPAFFVFPYLGFLNIFARDILQIGASGLGLLMAASGAGAVIGSLLVAARSRSESVGRQLVAATIIYGVVLMAMSLSHSVPLTMALLFTAGLLGAAFMSANNAAIQHRISDDVRGRVMGAYLLTFGLMPLGALPLGFLAARIGAPMAVFVGAALSTALSAWLGFSSRALREI
ncbi:MAG: MFS transporter [Thermomicrobiales bacterium]|nr:MFS transporter [Thermomicrobiales bacterium]